MKEEIVGGGKLSMEGATQVIIDLLGLLKMVEKTCETCVAAIDAGEPEPDGIGVKGVLAAMRDGIGVGVIRILQKHATPATDEELAKAKAAGGIGVVVH